MYLSTAAEPVEVIVSSDTGDGTGKAGLPKNSEDQRSAALGGSMSLALLRVTLSSSVLNFHHGEISTAPASGSLNFGLSVTAEWGWRRCRSSIVVMLPPALSPPTTIWP